MGIKEKLRNGISKIKNNSNFKNGIIFAFFSFLNSGINFFITLALATILTQSDFGNLNLFNTSFTILTVLISLGTTSYVGAHYFSVSKEKLQKILTSIYIISISTFMLILIIFLIFSKNLAILSGIPTNMQIVGLIICFFQLYTTLNLDIWRLLEKPMKYGIYTTLMVISNLILTFYFVFKLHLGWQGRVYSMLITSFIFFLISITFLYHKKLIILQKVDKKTVIETLKFGIPIVPHSLTGWMRQGIDRYIINAMWGASAVGVFGFALNLSNIIFMIGMAFNASNSVFIYKSLSNPTISSDKILSKQIKFMLIFFTLISVIIYFTSYILIPLIYPKYIASISLLLATSLSALFQCIYLLFVNFIFYYKKTKTLMYVTVGTSLLHIVASYSLTRYSIMYTAYVGLASSIIICIFVSYFGLKYKNKYKRVRE